MEQNDRRTEPRIPSKGAVQLTADGSPGGVKRIATIIDISRSGIQVELDDPIELASRVELQVGSMTVLGRVGNCRSHGAARFRVGILTEDVIEHAAS